MSDKRNIMANEDDILLSLTEIESRYNIGKDEFLHKANEYRIPQDTSGKYKQKILDKYFVICEKEAYDSKIIAISNQKGGEGKTTISLFLTEAMAENKRLLLIDWDPQANATKLVLNDVDESIFECLGYRNTAKTPVHRVVHRLKSGYDFLPSAISLANLTTPFEIGDFQLLKECLLPLRSSYEYIIIDCPPSLGLGLENALIAADYVIIPIQTRIFSVQGLQDLYTTFEKIRSKANPNLKLLGAVLNQYEESRALSGLSVGIKKYFPVFQTVVPRRESIPQAQAKRKLLSGCDRVSRTAFYNLAHEVQELIHVKEK